MSEVDQQKQLHEGACTCPACAPHLWNAGIKGITPVSGLSQPSSTSNERACTCHPDDRPPICQHRYAATECQAAYRKTNCLKHGPHAAGECPQCDELAEARSIVATTYIPPADIDARFEAWWAASPEPWNDAKSLARLAWQASAKPSGVETTAYRFPRAAAGSDWTIDTNFLLAVHQKVGIPEHFDHCDMEHIEEVLLALEKVSPRAPWAADPDAQPTGRAESTAEGSTQKASAPADERRPDEAL